MTNQKNDKTEEWDFSVDTSSVKKEDQESKEHKKPEVKKTRVLEKKTPKLTLDEAALPPRNKTRSAMALELEKEEAKKEEDVYSLAPIPKRGIAFILDVLFQAALVYLTKMSAPLWRILIQLFLDRYKLHFIIPEPQVMKIIMGVSGFMSFFIFVVIPIAFYNTSFGKKLMGLRVRGSERYTISISQAFKRELIFKPISVLILAGFITPFFSKMRLSIHDMLANTFVMED